MKLSFHTDEFGLGIAPRIFAILPNAPSEKDFEEIEKRLLALPQIELPLEHRFSFGVYMREILMPAGTFVIGAKHRTEHLNIITQGRALVMMDGIIREVTAPCTFVSGAGVRKTLYIAEEMRWATIHLNLDNERDIEVLEGRLVDFNPTELEHRADLAKLRKSVYHEPLQLAAA